MDDKSGLYILQISVHGLIRGQNLELGRDADTGGQTKYVVDLCKNLVTHKDVDRIDILTRSIIDNKVGQDYSNPFEEVIPGCNIVRIPFGPRKYLRKEVLWPYLDSLVDSTIQYIRQLGRLPDIIHTHYADAGYVGSKLSRLLEIPQIHTGHSLGRVKLQRFLTQGAKQETIEKNYNIRQRIEAEEITLDCATWIIASTRQEIEEQYSMYDNYEPQRISVIPPGVDLNNFSPPTKGFNCINIKHKLDRFLRNNKKPLILAISRPDQRKNIRTLINVYGKSDKLREISNLIIILGNRDNILEMDRGTREVLHEMLQLVDLYDLYGQIAYPKSHEADDIPDYYRLAADRKGVFINPALTEPFGLTLIESAASGLPIVATDDGGPKDIIRYCDNGLLVDPLDENQIENALINVLSNKDQWLSWSKKGLKGVHRYFSWKSHIKEYLNSVSRIINKSHKGYYPSKYIKNRIITADRFIISDIDNTLLGDKKGLNVLFELVKSSQNKVGFAVATGRSLESALKVLKEWNIPTPDLLISSVGSEIHYGNRVINDINWEKHINFQWKHDRIFKIMNDIPGIVLQPEKNQRKHKISYYIDPQTAISIRKIRGILRRNNIRANVIYSHGQYLDILPLRASKGLAVRYFSMKWGIPLEQIIVAGDSGNDREMLLGNTLAIVVGNYSPELESLKDDPHVYFAQGNYAWGIVEGLKYYNFLNVK